MNKTSVLSKCDNCWFGPDCDEQMMIICASNNYCKYIQKDFSLECKKMPVKTPSVKVQIEERRNGCDCWGRPEYDLVYVVTDEDGNQIYETESDPTQLIKFLLNVRDTEN